MKLAVIATGGKQYIVSEGTVLTVEKLSGEPKKGDAVTFDQVLMIDDGLSAEVGTPGVAGAKVTGIVIDAGKADKVVVVRYKQKSRYLKRRGHRQPFTKVKIEKI